jgi:hypothetical protein
MMQQIKPRSIDVMIRNWIVVYIITTEQKNYLNQNLKKIQKSDENLRAELTHILLTRQHNIQTSNPTVTV